MALSATSRRGAAKNIKGRVLILHGAEDPTAPLSELDLAIKELRQTQVDWQLELYSGADHGFTTPSTPANDRANVRAWAATQKFSRKSSRTSSMRQCTSQAFSESRIRL
jgi:dienelactone hydrolase